MRLRKPKLCPEAREILSSRLGQLADDLHEQARVYKLAHRLCDPAAPCSDAAGTCTGQCPHLRGLVEPRHVALRQAADFVSDARKEARRS
jgi:hypothetical protein